MTMAESVAIDHGSLEDTQKDLFLTFRLGEEDYGMEIFM